jgi:hypothetical protein
MTLALVLLAHMSPGVCGNRYIEDVTAAGFVDVRTQDTTAAWADLTRTRAAAFGASQDRLTRITHGEEEVFHRLKVGALAPTEGRHPMLLFNPLFCDTTDCCWRTRCSTPKSRTCLPAGVWEAWSSPRESPSLRTRSNPA